MTEKHVYVCDHCRKEDGEPGFSRTVDSLPAGWIAVGGSMDTQPLHFCCGGHVAAYFDQAKEIGGRRTPLPRGV